MASNTATCSVKSFFSGELAYKRYIYVYIILFVIATEAFFVLYHIVRRADDLRGSSHACVIPLYDRVVIKDDTFLVCGEYHVEA